MTPRAAFLWLVVSTTWLSGACTLDFDDFGPAHDAGSSDAGNDGDVIEDGARAHDGSDDANVDANVDANDASSDGGTDADRPIAPECLGRTPNDVFCAGAVVRICDDELITYEDTLCPLHQSCNEVIPSHCACDIGFVNDGEGGCLDTDECSDGFGGQPACDPLTTCNNTDGSFTCSMCPAHYFQNPSDCLPIMTSLQVTGGVLDPAYEPQRNAYSIAIPLLPGRVTLAPTFHPDFNVTIEGDDVMSGSGWLSDRLPLAISALNLYVSDDVQPASHLTVAIDRGHNVSYVKSNVAQAGDAFGASVAASNETVVIGAPHDDAGIVGLSDAGSAYVLIDQARQARLIASNRGNDQRFGAAVAIDGDLIVVGAPGESAPDTGVTMPGPSPGGPITAVGSGAAYVFARSGNNWIQQAYFKASTSGANFAFGSSVAILGTSIAVGAPGEGTGGSVYVFSRASNTWSLTQRVTPTQAVDRDFGRSVALSSGVLAVGAPLSASGAGVAYTFARSTWALGSRELITGTIELGNAVALSDAFLVAASGDQYTYVLDLEGAVTTDAAVVVIADQCCNKRARSISLRGNMLAVGAPNEDVYSQGIHPSRPPDNGNPTFNAGAVYLYEHNGTSWVGNGYLASPNRDTLDGFGTSVALTDRTLTIGAPGESGPSTTITRSTDGFITADDTRPNSGAGYIY